MDIQNKVTLFFTAFGIVAGSISGGLALKGSKAPLALFIGLFLFYISYRLIPQVFDLVEEPLPDNGSKKIIMLGLLPFWLMWLVFWIMVYTLTL